MSRSESCPPSQDPQERSHSGRLSASFLCNYIRLFQGRIMRKWDQRCRSRLNIPLQWSGLGAALLSNTCSGILPLRHDLMIWKLYTRLYFVMQSCSRWRSILPSDVNKDAGFSSSHCTKSEEAELTRWSHQGARQMFFLTQASASPGLYVTHLPFRIMLSLLLSDKNKMYNPTTRDYKLCPWG